MQCLGSNIGQVTLNIQIMGIILRHTTLQGYHYDHNFTVKNNQLNKSTASPSPISTSYVTYYINETGNYQSILY